MSTAKKVKIVLIGLISALSLAVVIQNSEQVNAKILFLTVPVSLTLLLAAALLAGLALGLLAPILWRRAGGSADTIPDAVENAWSRLSSQPDSKAEFDSTPEQDSARTENDGSTGL